LLTFCLVCASLYSSLAQQSAATPLAIKRIEPMNWWVGMKNPSVQVLVYGPNIGKSSVRALTPLAGVQIKGTSTVENPNYLFVNLVISPKAKAGQILLQFSPQTDGKPQAGGSVIVSFPILERSKDKNRIQGFSAADAIYMLMPDRFSNGDTANDTIAGMPDITHRDSANARHGGDIQGIIKHLEYIKDAGFTAIWATPLLENNQIRYSYHGYGITDFYKIDARFGSNALYKQYVDSAHRLGLKVIKDMVLNHCGDQHWMLQDPPTRDWFNDYDTYKQSADWKKDIRKPNYRSSTISDPYSSQADRDAMNRRWFDWMLPDFNQKNTLLATYLIQNSIWWIEYAGIDGIRMDTYPYPDRDFSAQWSKAVMAEYPRFNVVGEVWIGESVGMTAYWLAGTKNRDGFVSHLPCATDFPLYEAMQKAFNEKEGWSEGLIRLNNTLASDFLYASPSSNVIFLDNHDTGRFFSTVGEDVRKLKLALAFLLTTRGAPQLYYGTEIAMPGVKDMDPNVRKDHPGGWPDDKQRGIRDAFTQQGRTERDNDVFNFTRTLLNWRKSTKLIHTGKLMQFLPQDGVYTYFRYAENTPEKAVMVLLNNNDTERTVNTSRFAERMKGFSKAKNVLTGEVLNDVTTLAVPAKMPLVMELMK
jgi:glycosidase